MLEKDLTITGLVEEVGQELTVEGHVVRTENQKKVTLDNGITIPVIAGTILGDEALLITPKTKGPNFRVARISSALIRGELERWFGEDQDPAPEDSQSLEVGTLSEAIQRNLVCPLTLRAS